MRREHDGGEEERNKSDDEQVFSLSGPPHLETGSGKDESLS